MITLIVLNPVLAVVVAGVECLAIAANLSNAQRQAQLAVQNSIRSRRQQSYGTMLSNAVVAKEVRLFGLGDFLRGRMLTELHAINGAEAALGRRLLWVESVLAALSAGVIAGGLVWTVTQVADGHLPVGDVSLFVMAAMGMQGAMNQIAMALGGVTQSVTLFGAYTDVVSAPPDLPVTASPVAAAALRQGISVENVWFRYDESHPWVLRGLSMFIPAGAASVDVSAARIKGDVGANWRGAYDLLVLPAGSAQTGTQKQLAQVNYLSAATSGITTSQYQRIGRLPGVGVAAPLAIVGYVLETAYPPVTLSATATGPSGARVLSVTSQFTADQGLSKFPAQPQGYVYITPDQVASQQPGPGGLTDVEKLPDGKSVSVCGSGNAQAAQQGSPFAATTDTGLDSCYSRAGPGSGPVQGTVKWSFPVLVAGIDPRAENQLTGLSHAMTAGRYLSEADKGSAVGSSGVVVPLIGSSSSFDGDNDHVTVSLLPSAAVGLARSGGAPERIAQTLDAEPGTPVMRATITGEQAWRQLLTELAPAVTADQSNVAQTVGQYWTARQVSYDRGPGGELEPVPVSNPASVWTAGLNVNGLKYVAAPPAAADTGFRVLTEYTENSAPGRTGVKQPYLRVVGTFNPAQLAGFAGQGPGSPLASYRAPLLTGADAASRQALGSGQLEPDGNMAGYAQQPPLLYTTLAGAAALEGPAAAGTGGGQATAPIGSIRVRVSGLRGSVQQQLAKVGAVGQEIETATGLHVIVTAGASPQPVTIGLPAGAFGRPQLRLTEDWTAISVALVVLRQADRESLALFVLILVVCGLFLAGAALAGVRGRRAEIGALRAVGWGRGQVFTMILGEVVVLGVAAGLAGAALSAVLIAGLKLSVPLWRAVLVLPVAAVLAGVSGLVPAWLAARVPPAAALTPVVRAPRRGGRPIRSVTGLAVTGVARVPGRCALAGTGLAAGVAGLTVLLATHVSFGTSIGDSELAGLVTASTRGDDLVSAVLTIALSAVAIADLTYLGLRERAGELAALAASGWGRAQLGRLLATEAVITAVAGSLVGGAAGLAVAATAFGLSMAIVLAAIGAAVGGTVVALAATTVVLTFTAGRPLAAVLATDE
jgi:putative ABC transport system permease protein